MYKYLLVIALLAIGCKKNSNNSNSTKPFDGSYSYTITDTTGIASTYSDTSYITGQQGSPCYIDEFPNTLPVPAAYIDLINGQRVFTFQSWRINYITDPISGIKTGLQNKVNFTMGSLAGTTTNVSLVVNNLNYIEISPYYYFPYSGTATTTISDSSNAKLTGSFHITGMTITGKAITVNGIFSGIPIFPN